MKLEETTNKVQQTQEGSLLSLFRGSQSPREIPDEDELSPISEINRLPLQKKAKGLRRSYTPPVVKSALLSKVYPELSTPCDELELATKPHSEWELQSNLADGDEAKKTQQKQFRVILPYSSQWIRLSSKSRLKLARFVLALCQLDATETTFALLDLGISTPSQDSADGVFKFVSDLFSGYVSEGSGAL